jgi:hypothetical protein
MVHCFFNEKLFLEDFKELHELHNVVPKIINAFLEVY